MKFIPLMYENMKEDAKTVAKTVKRYQVPIIFTTGVVAGFWITKEGQDTNLGKQIRALKEELGYIHEEHMDLCEFVDSKGLREEFFAFAKDLRGVEYVAVGD